ncbi:hypothetical protein PVL29_000769 [Vitis rotundifolia]|uniref:Amine oxidase domain-containing protein n=2 Tax=Vitis rotundifolia TaxID=103349 RepID=A0AA39E7X6_VITRO|nr:hypothetical protein PVL29_000769 [Vitis rotundifolia]
MGIRRTRLMLASLIVIMGTLLGCPGAATAKRAPTVIIVGAGMSGISAAKTLSDAGIKRILILEATNRIGGRMYKANFSGVSVELGANWVSGVGGPQVNPIWIMANKLRLKSFLSNFQNISSNTYKPVGGVYEESVARKAFEVAEQVVEFGTEVSKDLAARKQPDISILTSQRLKNYFPKTPLEMVIDYYLCDFESAEPPRATSLLNSVPSSTYSNFGEDSYFVADPRGYESVVHYVAQQFLTTNAAGQITDPRLQLKKVVTEISRSPRGVAVKTEDGLVHRADYVIVSVSLGVLQNNLIKFHPSLPQWKILALDQFNMAIYTKIFLKFPYKFWPSGNGTEFFLYAHEKRGYYPFWQHLEREFPGENVLFVTVTDDESRRLEQQSDSETKAEIMAVLRNMFGKQIPEATDILVPRWLSNRFYKGSYSNWPIGVSHHQFNQIKAPVGKVYFTGEHTSAAYYGYVHGAYFAGIDTAKLMTSCIKRGACSYSI